MFKFWTLAILAESSNWLIMVCTLCCWNILSWSEFLKSKYFQDQVSLRIQAIISVKVTRFFGAPLFMSVWKGLVAFISHLIHLLQGLIIIKNGNAPGGEPQGTETMSWSESHSKPKQVTMCFPWDWTALRYQHFVLIFPRGCAPKVSTAPITMRAWEGIKNNSIPPKINFATANDYHFERLRTRW